MTSFEESHLDFTHPVRYRVITPDDDRSTPRPVLLALHGMGMDAPGFQRILRHLETKEMILVVPDGPYPYEIRREGKITIGHAWYLYRGDQEEFYEHLETSERHVLHLLDRIEAQRPIDRGRSVVLGFSQGGYLAGFMALRHPERFGGLVIASSRLKWEFVRHELEEGPIPPTLFLHSKQDNSIPWDRVEEGQRRLEAAGGRAVVYLHDEGHRLPPDAVVRLGEWLGEHGFDEGYREAAQVKTAWRRLEEGDPEAALELVRGAIEENDPEAMLIAAAASLDLEELTEARRYLEMMEQYEFDADTEYLRRFYLGQAYFLLGHPDRALDALAPLEPADPVERANVEWWTGLAYDHLGKSTRADACFQRAIDLDPEGAPRPASLTEDEVEAIVAEVAGELPAALQKCFEEVPVVIQDLPPRAAIQESNGALAPDTLGLYSGSSLLEQSVLDVAPYPPTIFIYRRNLERFAVDEDDLREQVRITLLHELGHHLGYEEDDLDRLGLA